MSLRKECSINIASGWNTVKDIHLRRATGMRMKREKGQWIDWIAMMMVRRRGRKRT